MISKKIFFDMIESDDSLEFIHQMKLNAKNEKELSDACCLESLYRNYFWLRTRKSNEMYKKGLIMYLIEIGVLYDDGTDEE